MGLILGKERVLKLVVILVSSLRTDHVGPCGNRWIHTPSLARLATVGRTFTKARCEVPDPVLTRMELLTGLRSRRFGSPIEGFGAYHGEFTLPALLASAGVRTALFTDNYPQWAMYERLNGFDVVHVVPGQGADRHRQKLPAQTLAVQPESVDSVICGSSRRPADADVDRYLQNRARYAYVNHPSVRLFDEAADYLEHSSDPNAFVLVDSFYLQPPWDPPRTFFQYRRAEDAGTLVWPGAGAVDSSAPDWSDRLNVLRRAYADSCVFVDNLVGKIPVGDWTVVFLSDHGVLIGDEDYILGRPDRESSILTDQVLIVADPRIRETNTRLDIPISPVDLFASIYARVTDQSPPPGDGKAIPELFL